MQQYSQACIRVQFGNYSLMARIKVKMKRSLMLGTPKIDSPLLLTWFEIWWCLRRLCTLIISCCIWNMWQECMVEFLHSLWAMVVWFNLIRLADVAMVEVLHLTKCTQLMQQWIRIALLLFTTGELFRKKMCCFSQESAAVTIIWRIKKT